jgi:hypothetical protein
LPKVADLAPWHPGNALGRQHGLRDSPGPSSAPWPPAARSGQPPPAPGAAPPVRVCGRLASGAAPG